MPSMQPILQGVSMYYEIEKKTKVEVKQMYKKVVFSGKDLERTILIDRQNSFYCLSKNQMPTKVYDFKDLGFPDIAICTGLKLGRCLENKINIDYFVERSDLINKRMFDVNLTLGQFKLLKKRQEEILVLLLNEIEKKF